MRQDCCDGCGRWTAEGEREWRANLKPIYGTDFTKPLSETIEELRNQITKVRGQLSDIGFRHPGWGERVACIEGLMTCGLIALHGVREEMLASEKRDAQP